MSYVIALLLLAVLGIQFRVLSLQHTIIRKENQIMSTLADTLAKVTETRGKVASLIALTTDIRARLNAALSGVLTPEQQAQVDSIFNEVEAAGTEVVTAINANDDDPNT